MLQDAKGLSVAMQEVRDLGKWTCLLPRHPTLARPERLSCLCERSTLLSAAAHAERVAKEAGVELESLVVPKVCSDDEVLREPLRSFLESE